MVHWSSALDGLSDDQKKLICTRRVLKVVRARTSIFEANDEASALYIIKSGRVRLIYRNREGSEFTTGVWTKGYVVGLISTFLNEPRFLAAESIEQTELHELSRENLHSLMREIPAFTINIAGILGRLAHDSILRSGPLATQSATHRLASTLIRLASPVEASPGSSKSPDRPNPSTQSDFFVSTDSQRRDVWVVQGLTQEDLARLVGVSRSWVNTTLASLEERNLIRRLKGSIEIVDLDKLQRLFSFD